MISLKDVLQIEKKKNVRAKARNKFSFVDFTLLFQTIALAIY